MCTKRRGESAGGGGHNKASTRANSDKSKKRKSSLLIEPSVEEERLADEKSFDFTTHHRHAINLIKQSDTYKNKNQTGQETPTPSCNVILDDRNNQSSFNRNKQQQQQRTRQKSHLTSLLMILFGSICLLIGCLAIQPTWAVASPTIANTNPVIHKVFKNNQNISATINQASQLKPLKLSEVSSIQVVKKLTTTTTTPKPKVLVIQINQNNTNNATSRSNRSFTGFLSDEKNKTAATTTTSPLVVTESFVAALRTESDLSSSLVSDKSVASDDGNAVSTSNSNSNSSAAESASEEDGNSPGETASTPSATAAAAEATGGGDEEEEDAEQGENNNNNNKNKLSDLILSTANDASDLLISKLKDNKEESSNENDESSANEDSGEDLSTSTETTNSIAAPIASSNVMNNLAGSGVVGSDDKSARNKSSAGSEILSNKRQLPIISSVSSDQKEDIEAEHNKTRAKELKIAMDTYVRWKTTADEVIELVSKKFLPIIVEHGYDVDSVTVTGVLQVFNAFKSLKPWALKLLDSWTKLAPGVLVGTQSDFGDYDECLSIRVDDPNGFEAANSDIPIEYDELTGLKKTTIVGKYCLADVEFPKPPRNKLLKRNEELNTDFAPIELRKPLLDFNETVLFKDTIFVETANFFHMLYVDPIRAGFCLTNKVDPESFTKVFNILVKDFGVTIDFKNRCVTKYDKIEWTTKQKVSWWILLVTCSLVVLCTLLDVIHLKLNKLPFFIGQLFYSEEKLRMWKLNLRLALFKYRPLFTSFSIIRNTKRLFRSQQDTGKFFNQQQQQQQQTQQHFTRQNNQAQISSSCGSSTGGSLSTESSPSIERRSNSVTGSNFNLISSSSEYGSSIGGSAINSGEAKKNLSLSQFEHSNHHNMMIKQQLNNSHQLSSTAIINTDCCHSLKAPDLNCLHGIRVITMTWMIVNHTYLFGGFFVLWAHRRLIDIAEWPKSLSFQLVLNGWLTVETYFFLSALIIVLNVMPLLKAKKFGYFQYILHRLVRLLPAYVGLVCLNFLWPLVSSGPVWLVKGKSFIQTPCENYLWTNFLFINNWIWPEKQCMVHTWFLSADLQLYLLAPIIVYLLYRRPVFGHSLNIIIAIIASIVSGLVIYANKLMPTTLINKLEFDSIKQQLSYSYFATYQHMGPYCLGIFTGYLLYKRPQVYLPKHLSWTLWLLLPPLSFTTLLLTYLWNGAYDDPDLINPSPIVSAFYVAIHRTIWTSLVAWIVFSCSTGRSQLISNFLSHPIFIPLSRLNFSIYLVHLPIIMFRALNLRHTIEWTDSNILWEACGNFIFSLIAGYFVNIAFESPFINLEAILFGRGKLAEEEANKKNKHNNCCCCVGRDLQVGSNDVAAYPPSNASGGEQSANTTPEQEHRKLDHTNGPSSTETSLEGSPVIGFYNSKNNVAHSNNNNWNLTSLDSNLNQKQQATLSQRKTLRPKQISSVEKIFGHQLEPQANQPSNNDNNNDSSTGSDSNPGEDVNTKTTSAKLSRISASLMSSNKPLAPAQDNDVDVDDDDDNDVLYPIQDRFNKGGDSNWSSRLKPDFDETEPTRSYDNHMLQRSPLTHYRPSQYATLARTSQFNHHDSYPFKSNRHYHPDTELPFYNNKNNSPSVYNKRDPYGLERPVINRTTASYLGEINSAKPQTGSLRQHTSVYTEPTESDLFRFDAATPISQQQLTGGQAFVSGQHLNRRKRQGRYNTLTGSNSLAEYRQKYDMYGRFSDRQDLLYSNFDGDLHHLETSAWLQQQQQSLSGAGMLMIPRIDSSTLRRQQQHNKRPPLDQHQHHQQQQQQQASSVNNQTTTEQHSQGSIIEEPTNLSSSSSSEEDNDNNMSVDL